MKNSNRYLSFLILVICGFVFFSCEDQNIPEPLEIQKKEQKVAEYYANLRAYKRSDHAIAFGWFGGWTATGASTKSRLCNIPDSMDLVAIWGNCFNVSPERKKDMEYVQKEKGTRVVICWIIANVGDQLGGENFNHLKTHEEKMSAYAKAIVDTVMKYNYDGFEIDYEPNYGSRGNIATNKDSMLYFVKELGKYLGPQSDSGKLLMIDGEPDYLKSEAGIYFDYFISQAYRTSSPSQLDRRYNSMKHLEGFAPGKYIVTENFESLWKEGGVNYRDEDGNQMPSLLGMARWNPEDGRKGGVGAYHFEYEFVHNPDYKFMREAIQIMNPAVE